MPRTGTPAPSRPAGAGGAPSAYTEAGPPDRMTAFGLRASICAAGMLAGTISEYTWHSLTRRAISCAYWAPKSTTRTVSCSGAGCTMPPSARASHAPWRGRPVSIELRKRRGWPGFPGGTGPGAGARVRRRRADPDSRDAAGVHLGHGQPVPVHLDGIPHHRQLAELREHVAGHRLVRPLRQAHPGLLGELVQVQQAVHLDLAAGQLARAAFFVVLVPDVPDQLFHQVLERHDARGAAVLVHHDRQVGPVAAHLRERRQHPLVDRYAVH